ncbi:NAD(P)H oxidoreductase [Paenibacillus sp. FSL R7-0297]|uniref:NAD(P)H oxidoreductase n=1 Tax=unclassified Paenibacillus TaxID=185978 RepID=UPI0004F8696F|nr:NAD(P)H oxidoreductase [Paenibacillus sp. FSL R5-0912]AIQ42760.1 NAD(P)H dehydrogenase [Paenibacillus sp. FSL R5-0912]
MNVLIVVSHPRQDSLTFQVARRFAQGLTAAGHGYEILDLHEIGFDPILRERDEPDLSLAEQSFSPEVEREMQRMKEHDALAFVFPVWWWHLPAMLKGYVDRVLNNGFAYGTSQLPHQHALWLALAGVTQEQMKKRNYDEAIMQLLNVGIADYCGITDSRVEFLYETTSSDPSHYGVLLEQAYQAGLNYGKGEHSQKFL